MSDLSRRAGWAAAAVVTIAGVTAAATTPIASASPGSPAAAESTNAALAGIYQMSATSSLLRIHPILGLVAPDALGMDIGYAHAELQSTPLGLALAGPANIPAAGLLSFLGLPSLPPNALPSCSAAQPGGLAEASCVGPAVDGGGGNSLFAANGTAKSHVVPEDPAQSLVTAQATSGGATGFGFTYTGGQATSRSQPSDEGWVSASDASISGLNIAGVVTIDSIRSFARVVANGEQSSAVSERGLEVVGARVFGTPVVITSEGVQIADQASPADTRAAQDAIDSALKQAGLTIRLVPPAPSAASKAGTEASADSGGVAVQSIFPGLPPGNEARLIFGRSTAEVTANQVPGAAGAATVPLGSTAAGGTAPGVLPSTADSAFAPPAGAAGVVPGLVEAGVPAAAVPAAAGASNASFVRRALPVSYLVETDCGFACTYGVFGVVAFALPVAYISRRYLLGA